MQSRRSEIAAKPHSLDGLQAMLIIVWHSRTGASEAMARAVFAGAGGEAGGRARLLRAQDVQAPDLLAGGGYVFCCPENLGAMSGLMKDMFDRTFYDVLGRVEGRPYASIIAAGNAGQGAQAQMDRILTGWRLRRIAEPICVNFNAQSPEEIWAAKRVDSASLLICQGLGSAMVEGMAAGIF